MTHRFNSCVNSMVLVRSGSKSVMHTLHLYYWVCTISRSLCTVMVRSKLQSRVGLTSTASGPCSRAACSARTFPSRGLAWPGARLYSQYSPSTVHAHARLPCKIVRQHTPNGLCPVIALPLSPHLIITVRY